MAQVTDTDVLVVGGGPAGLATAIELTGLGVRVVVAEARDAPAERYGETLAPGASARLDRLGLGETFRGAGHLPCPGTVVRWGRDRPGHNDFLLDPLGPAWHLDRARFESMLRTRAEEAGASVLTSTRVVAVDGLPDRVRALLRTAGGERTVRAGWVVDASGPAASIARRRGARRLVVDRLVALVRIADLAGPLSAQTLVESAPDGWWYAARLPGERLVTVFVTDPGEVRALTADGWAGWRRALDATVLLADRLAGVWLAGLRPAGVRPAPASGLVDWRVRSLGVSRLDCPAGDRWLAVGDAAATLDPIGGRGIHEALGDAADAARAITEALPGRAPDATGYAERVRARFDDHVVDRAGWYGLERRWPSATFWAARHRETGEGRRAKRSAT